MFSKIKNIFKKAKLPVGDIFNAAFKGGKLEDYEYIEEQLIMADIGIETSQKIIQELKREVKNGVIIGRENIIEELQKILFNIMLDPIYPKEDKRPIVLLISGINGTGKTTSIAKLAKYYKQKKYKILLGAADTFRAAADEQLRIWAEKIGGDIFLPETEKDPAAVAYSAYVKAQNEKYDVLIIDTAGRMHTNYNLMSEIKKIYTVLKNKFENINLFSILVIDGTTGKNALSQTKQFKNTIHIDTLFLTKIDGTAKGGTVITIADELHLPISYIGVGEKKEDLWLFDKNEFIRSIISNN